MQCAKTLSLYIYCSLLLTMVLSMLFFTKKEGKNKMIKIRVRTKYWTAYSIEHRGILRSLLNIYVETFCENRSGLLAWIFLLALNTPLEGVLANYLKNIYRTFTKYSSLSSNLVNFQKQPKSCWFTWRKLCKNIKAIFVKPFILWNIIGWLLLQ